MDWRTGVQFVAVRGVITSFQTMFIQHFSGILAVLSIGEMLLECEADHSLLSSSKLKKYYIILQLITCVLMAWCPGTSLLLPCVENVIDMLIQ